MKIYNAVVAEAEGTSYIGTLMNCPSFAFVTNRARSSVCPGFAFGTDSARNSVCPSFAFGTDVARGSVCFGPNQGIIRKPNIAVTRGKITR